MCQCFSLVLGFGQTQDLHNGKKFQFWSFLIRTSSFTCMQWVLKTAYGLSYVIVFYRGDGHLFLYQDSVKHKYAS